MPPELLQYKSWIVWGAPGTTGSEAKAPWSPVTGREASVVQPAGWASYEQADRFAKTYGFSGVGFVLSSNDPFGFIDLDDTEGNSEFARRQEDIFRKFNSYAEISPSKRGLHIIVRGDVPRGVRRNKIEVYSKARYMLSLIHI